MGALDQRPNFFEGQYLGADDLDALVGYLRGVDGRHALGGHVWGIAVGLNLVERTAPLNRRDVIIEPGYAWDGFGRTIVIDQEQRLSESLFSAIAYNPAFDDTTAGGKGRLVPVWITYVEAGVQGPADGFETCALGATNSRIAESWRIVIGPQTGAALRAPVDVGGQSSDAQAALTQFDAGAMTLYDTSVPQQTPPTDPPAPRWLIPLGVVRWIAAQSGTGYFVDRNLDPADRADDVLRASRRYAGVVAESIEAADGAIVLHRRGEDPSAPHRFKALMQGTQGSAALLKDLVWVEGNLRVEGDAKLAGGQLLLRDADGLDQQTPLYLARQGDGALLPGNRELRAVIGAAGQNDNRFVVGPEQGGPPTVAPNFVVTSGGNVGVGTRTPAEKVHVAGRFLRVDGAGNEQAYLGGDGVGNDVQVGSLNPGVNLLAVYNATAATFMDVHSRDLYADRNIGVGTTAPAERVHVAGKFLRVDGLGNEQAYIGGDGIGNDVQIGSLNPGVNLLAVYNATAGFWMNVHCRDLYADGNIGIGTVTPNERLHVAGKFLRVDGLGNEQAYLGGDGIGNDVQIGSLNPAVSLIAAWNAGSNTMMNVIGRDLYATGSIGIGTTAPAQRLHVAGSFLRVDGAGNEQAYIGGDGSFPFPDVQIGSFNSAIGSVHLWNIGYGGWMDLSCASLFTHSDGNAKKNVAPLEGALDQVLALRGVSFEWKKDRGANDGAYGGARRQIGVIAQEVEKVVPEAVRHARGEAGVNYSALVPLLLEAIKELKAQVDNLSARVASPAASPVAARAASPVVAPPVPPPARASARKKPVRK
ncbi:MAG: tail fiber domain-containing protein [Caldimonas sp.]